MKKETLKKGSTIGMLAAAALLGTSEASAMEISSGSDKVQVQLYGEVDRAVMQADDGWQDKFFHVDNANSETKVGVAGMVEATDYLTVGSNFELKWQTNPSNGLSMDEESISGEFQEELLEVWFDFKSAGKLSIGQGEMASDVSSEIDLSGTDLVGNAGVADVGGGLGFYDAAGGGYGGEAGFTVESVFNGGISSEGLGKRSRVRYETPSFAGFVFSAAAGEEEIVDAAIAYSSEFGGNQLEAEAAWSNPSEDGTQLNGSVSLLLASGLNFTVAGSIKDMDDMPPDGDDPTFMYGKLGYIFDQLLSVGATFFSVDYGVYSNAAVLDIEQEAKAAGMQFVQELAGCGADLYAAYRSFSLEDNSQADYEDISIFIVGAKISF